MKWLKLGGGALAVVLAGLAVAPSLLSLDEYLPRIEASATERLGQPVKIDKLHLTLLPVPRVSLSNLRVGPGGELEAGKATVVPDLWSLLSATRVIRKIEVDGLVLTQEAIGMLQAVVREAAPAGGEGGSGQREAGGVRVRALELRNAVLKLPPATIGPLKVQVRLMQAGGLESASLAMQDGRIKLDLRPDAKGYLIELHAREWTVPAGPAFHFQQLSVKGFATNDGARLEEIAARLYEGNATGRLDVGWTSGVQLEGELDVKGVSVAPLLRVLDRPATLSGKLTAHPVFAARARKPEELGKAVRLSTPFEIHGGVLHGVDIARAAVSIIDREQARGGETRFDRLSGHLALERGTRRLTGLRIASGALSATGQVTVSPRDQLSGRLNATVAAASLGSASIPLNVTGSLEAPLVYPTGGTVAGAAVGTAILGPVGAGIGAKMGQWAEGLFGSSDDAKR